MNRNRLRRYAQKWARYQDRSDALVNGPELWFKGHEYPGMWKSRWRLRRLQMINTGVPSSMLTPIRKSEY
jgi:hypothetical protein